MLCRSSLILLIWAFVFSFVYVQVEICRFAYHDQLAKVRIEIKGISEWTGIEVRVVDMIALFWYQCIYTFCNVLCL